MKKFDFNEYLKEYNKKNIVHLSLNLNKSKDADIIEALETLKEDSKESKQATLKRLIRRGINKN